MKGRFCVSKRLTLASVGVVTIAVVLFLLRSILFVSTSLNSKAAPPKNNPSVVGGRDVLDSKKWPFMASFVTTQGAFMGKDWQGFPQGCSGTFIASNWILTAAHCVVKTNSDAAHPKALSYLDKDMIYLSYGSNRSIRYVYDNFKSNLELFNVGDYTIHLHEGYTKVRDNAVPPNDIALIELKKPIASVISVLTYNKSSSNQQEGKMSVILGWGDMSAGNPSFYLQQAVLPLMSNVVTNNIYQYFYNIAPTPPLLKLNEVTEIAAGFMGGGVSICSGDSGGPLLIWNGFDWIQIGVASWIGQGTCGEMKNPGVFTRVAPYAEWIKNTVTTTIGSSELFKGKALPYSELVDYCARAETNKLFPIECRVRNGPR